MKTKTIIMSAIVLVLALSLFTSCRNGYGCNGTAKEPTGTVNKKWKAGSRGLF